VLDTLLPIFEKEGWSHAQIVEDWGISLATLEGHLDQQEGLMAPPRRYIDWQRFDELKAQGLPLLRISAERASQRPPYGRVPSAETRHTRAHQKHTTRHRRHTHVHQKSQSYQRYTQEHQSLLTYHQTSSTPRHTQTHSLMPTPPKYTTGHSKDTRRSWRTSPKVSPMPPYRH
jgi:hypothetical protein